MPAGKQRPRRLRAVGTQPEDAEAKRIRERMDKIRRQLDAPTVTETLRRLPLRQGVRLDPLTDKITEALAALVGRPADFNRERMLRQECDQLANRLWKIRHLDDSVRRRPLRARIEDVREELERRAGGNERPGLSGPLLHEDGTVRVGPVEIREYGPDERSDRQYGYDLAVMDLYAIMRHLTEEDPRGEVSRFETISFILQAVGVIREDARDPGDAVRKRFKRANRWPKGITITKDTPAPVDFREDFLFALEGRGDNPRFPRQEPRLNPKFYAPTPDTPDRAPAPLTPEATPKH